MGFSGGAGNDSVIVTAFVANDVFSGGGGFDTIDFRQSGAT
jgi:hypothetical protein